MEYGADECLVRKVRKAECGEGAFVVGSAQNAPYPMWAECPLPNVGRRRVFPFKVLKVYCGLCNFQIHHRIAILCGDGTVGHDDDGATLGVGGQTLQ